MVSVHSYRVVRLNVDLYDMVCIYFDIGAWNSA